MKNKTQSLIEKAKGIEQKMKRSGKRVKITPGLIELALAWANDEISITSVTEALNFPRGLKGYTWIALALKEHIRMQSGKNKKE